MTQLSPEPVAYYIYVEEHQNGYVVESLNDACDDLTNHNAVSTPLYTAPHPQFTDAEIEQVLRVMKQSALYIVGVIETCKDDAEASRLFLKTHRRNLTECKSAINLINERMK